MKKVNYFIFSFCLFFVLIFSASAKELNFSGNTININNYKYPYFFIINSTNPDFDYYVFYLTEDNMNDFYLNNKSITTYEFKAYSRFRYCSFKDSNYSCYEDKFAHIETNEAHYLGNFDVKDSSGTVVFMNNYTEVNKPFKFPVEIKNFPLSKFGKGSSTYNEIYTNVKNYIKEHSSECKYYSIAGGWETYNDENGNFPAIYLTCFEDDTAFYGCPAKHKDGEINIYIDANTNTRYEYIFGPNNYIYDSSDKGYSFLSYSLSSNKLLFRNENIVKNDDYYFETNFDKFSFNCSTLDDWFDGKIYDSIVYKGKEYKVGGSEIINLNKNTPSISSKLVNETKDEFNTVISQTYSFTWNIYDITKFDYYFSSDGKNYSISSRKDLELTFVENGTVYFKVTDKNKSNVLYSYKLDINDINKIKTDGSLNQEDYFFGNLIDSNMKDLNDSLDNDTTIAQIFQWFKDKFDWLIDNKFGIIRQFSLFYNTYKELDFTSYGDNRFFYVDIDDMYFGCNYGIDPNNWGEIQCMHLDLSELSFLKKFNIDSDDIYIFNFTTKEMQNLLRLFRTFVTLIIGSYTFLKCYRLVVRFLDNFNLGGV